jgi:hypothetical protein
MKNLRIFPVMMAGVIAVPAFASTWANIGKSTSGDNYDVDLDSVHRDGNLVTFTVRSQYAPAVAATGADGFVAIRQANCADRSYVDIHTDYMKGGKVLNSTTEEDKHNAASGTVAGGVLEKACSK